MWASLKEGKQLEASVEWCAGADVVVVVFVVVVVGTWRRGPLEKSSMASPVRVGCRNRQRRRGFAELLLSQWYNGWIPLQPVFHALSASSASRVDCRFKLIGNSLEEGV